MPVGVLYLRCQLATYSRKRKGRRRIVSKTVSRGREAGQQAEVLSSGGHGVARPSAAGWPWAS